MRKNELFFSLLSLLFCCALLTLGCFFFYISQSDSAIQKMGELFEQSHFFLWIGVGCCCLAAALLGLFYLKYKRQYLLVVMGEKQQFSIDPRVFQEIAQNCLKVLFPHQTMYCEAYRYKKRKVEICVDLPSTPLDQQETLLKKIEYLLKTEFKKCCGYEEGFLLNVHFDTE